MDNEIRKHFYCADCGYDTFHNEYYMVHDHIWAQAGMDKQGGMLCIGDLERRTGRKLNYTDFTHAPINYLGTFSRRLQNRLNSHGKETTNHSTTELY